MLLAPALVNDRALGCQDARITKSTKIQGVAAASRATNEVIYKESRDNANKSTSGSRRRRNNRRDRQCANDIDCLTYSVEFRGTILICTSAATT
jgi:hypothetical protein